MEYISEQVAKDREYTAAVREADPRHYTVVWEGGLFQSGRDVPIQEPEAMSRWHCQVTASNPHDAAHTVQYVHRVHRVIGVIDQDSMR